MGLLGYKIYHVPSKHPRPCVKSRKKLHEKSYDQRADVT